MNEKTIELLTERLVNRINKANEFFLTKIGESVKKIRELKPTQAQQLVQILKYGGNYEEIINEISRITNLNIQDIDAIFNEMAKKDYAFAEKFYKYRGVEYLPYNENKALLRQVSALASITKQEMYNYARTTNLGYSIRDLQDNVKFVGLRETYNRVLDEAVLNVGTGVDTFDNAMSKIMKDVGGSGLKTVDYASGRSIRLDSAARMHLKGALRTLHNEIQKQVGEEFDFDGYEISVHSNPAVDHEKIQGRQFSIEEYEKLNNGFEAKDYKGNTYTLDHDSNGSYRPISKMSCYHYIFSIVLGVSKPTYSDEELKKIIDENNDGFNFEGNHYSLYDGEQLLRKIELELRKSKDMQIMGRASGNKQIVEKAQTRITQLTNKYRDVLKASGLKSKLERARVAGYHRVNVDKIK